MSLLADALQPLVVKQLGSLSGRVPSTTLADVIISPTAGYDLLFDNSDDSITLDFRDHRLLVSALAADYCRFSLAAFQSISQVPSEIMERDNVAWSLVKVYYSAFYAGHALIRMFGESCTFFDRPHIARLVDLGLALGRERTFNIEGGLYQCILSENATALRCVRARGTSGGAHESFWAIFGARVQELSEAILRGTLVQTDAQAAFGQVDALGEIMRRRAASSWLSAVRNEIQYRHVHSVWFPERIRVAERRILSRLIADWQKDPMTINLSIRHQGLLPEYVASCVFVVALCNSMLMWLADRSPAAARSFVHPGPMTFLNDIRARTAEVE